MCRHYRYYREGSNSWEFDKKLEGNGILIHPGIKSVFNILYGYTSGVNGICHTGNIGGSVSTFEEVKFMPVSCSAYINYLTALIAD